MNKFLFIISLFLFSCSNDTKLTAEKFLEGINSSKINLIDVRTYDEFASGHIPNAINIGVDGGFAPWVGALIIDLKQPILLIVDEGRAEEVVTRVSRVGYDNIKKMREEIDNHNLKK